MWRLYSSLYSPCTSVSSLLTCHHIYIYIYLYKYLMHTRSESSGFTWSLKCSRQSPTDLTIGSSSQPSPDHVIADGSRMIAPPQNSFVPHHSLRFPMKTFICEAADWYRKCVSQALRKCLLFKYDAILPRVATCIRAIDGLPPTDICDEYEAFICR